MDGTTQITTISDDLNQVVRDTALLAKLSISTWSGLRTDKELLNQLKAQHGAHGDVGKVVKNQLAGADAELKAARSAYGACRQRHYELTLRWSLSDRGPRLLPNLVFDKYLTEMGALKRRAEELRDVFLSAYPQLAAAGKANLGTMADAIYPSVEEVGAAFHIAFDFEPIPDSATAFTGLSEGAMHKLQAVMVQRQKALWAGAQAEMWANVSTKVKHLVERLSAVDSAKEPSEVRFFASSIDHVRDLLTLLPGWNCTGDTRVDHVVAELQAMLAGLDTKSVKDSAGVRSDAIKKGQSVMDQLQAWGLSE